MTAYLQQLVSFGLYKPSQGKIARQATFWAILLVVASGAWSLLGSMRNGDSEAVTNAAVPTALAVLAIGAWAAYRLIQLPKFADFLIGVEVEMNKVSWPGRTALVKASAVVIAVIFLLAGLLFAYDLLWEILLGWLLGR